MIFKSLNVFLISCLILVLFNIDILLFIDCSNDSNRSFIVDYPNKQFLKDGQPFRYISGSIHYFRVPRPFWKDRLQKMRYGGLNAIQTYVEWSSHEPEPGQFNFNGQNDLFEFIRLAQNENLLVILRVGPYICAERDMGGFPYWLLKIPGIKLRTSDPKYLQPVKRWLEFLLPQLKPFLYKNGGPIITIQMENEYGSYGCDLNYTTHLRDEFYRLLGKDIVLFTTDGNGDGYLRCGKVPHVLTTIDFGSGANVTSAMATLRRHMADGPFVNSEYYSGWIDNWQAEYQAVETEKFCKTLDELLQHNASVNIYVYHGGTNFDFTASTLYIGNVFRPVVTSYGYDAPINEEGDLTPKFFAVKDVIKKHFTIEDDHKYQDKIVNTSQKMSIPPVPLFFAGTIFDLLPKHSFIETKDPISFEDSNQAYGYLLYQTNITFQPTNPAVLSVPGLRDRAHVFIDQRFVGLLSRTQKFFNISFLAREGSELSLLVENQGRCSYACFSEKKGIISNVTVNDHHLLQNWKIYPIFNNWTDVIHNLQPISNLNEMFETCSEASTTLIQNYQIPSFYMGNFNTPDKKDYPLDTFLRVDGWSKGIAFLNGHNLGRYWPVAGPQITLYAPRVYFNGPGKQNQIILFETDFSTCWYQEECILFLILQIYQKSIFLVLKKWWPIRFNII